MTTLIRPVRSEDGPALAALMAMTKLAVDGVDYTHWTFPTLVAVSSGTLVGFVQALMGVPYAVITEFCVHPDYQRRGTAYRLMDHLETVLRSAGCPAWMAYTGQTNTGLREMAARWGATETGSGVALVRRLT